MNLLIVFVILTVLMISDAGNSHPVEDVWLRGFAILATLAAVPAFAAFQTVLATRKLRAEDYEEGKIQSMLDRLTACHSGVWMVSSLCVVYLLQWQQIVRGNWQLDRYPLLDETMIVAPIILSLIGSWFIFFDIQNVFVSDQRRIRIRERLRYVSLRVRVYLLVGLVPIFAAFAARDCLATFGNSVSASLLFTIAGLSLFLVLFPFLMLLVWKTSPLGETEIGSRLHEFCSDCRLKVAQIRQWDTGGAIINALVAGVLPYFRIILISDGLISQFNESQIRAILRHEAGHIRRWHLASRMVFIALPIVLITACHWVSGAVPFSIKSFAATHEVSELLVTSGLIVFYATYLLVVLVWLSWQMEYDADLYAITEREEVPGTGGVVTVCPRATDATIDALNRFAELMPSQVDRKTFWHPTLRKRLIRLQRIQRDPKLAQLNSDLFVHKQFLLFTLIVISIVTVQILINLFG